MKNHRLILKIKFSFFYCIIYRPHMYAHSHIPHMYTLTHPPHVHTHTSPTCTHPHIPHMYTHHPTPPTPTCTPHPTCTPPYLLLGSRCFFLACLFLCFCRGSRPSCGEWGTCVDGRCRWEHVYMCRWEHVYMCKKVNCPIGTG